MEILLCFIVVFVVILVIILLSMRTREKERENQLIQAYMESLQSFYGMIQNRIEMTRRYRHDLAKHIQTLEVMMEEEGNQDIAEYMDSLKVRYIELKKKEYCTDEVVNTVISIKKQQCEEKQIPMELEVADEDYKVIKDIDLVGVLYNLLDNAVEASERVPEGENCGIHLEMGKKEEQVWIRVENYINPEEKITFETSKEEKDEHGIGMKVISYLVKKYNGKQKIELDQKQNKILVEVWLKEEKE